MNDAAKQALLSALRSILVAIGAVIAKNGYADDATINQVIGAVMVIAPIAWGIYDKYASEARTKEREAVAAEAATVAATTTTKGTNP